MSPRCLVNVLLGNEMYLTTKSLRHHCMMLVFVPTDQYKSESVRTRDENLPEIVSCYRITDDESFKYSLSSLVFRI